ncbi:monothiol glutaredoxin-S6-like [Alnus glutinosa]|jgi:glutaredoxin 3|uniref:monothiol glutaredoxin-S6-like n=1 Tax=Alnus glutinosa TaxID=3517 RepID=UPI002D77D8E8|nr:monothiol glutaredoxin-S6-like [Alnus glutinosa]
MGSVVELVADRPVVIFSRSSCCMSHTVESLLRSFGANPTVYQLDQVSNGRQIEQELRQLGSQQSLPAVFIGQVFIGGNREINSLHLRNELLPLLRRARAIWV